MNTIRHLINRGFLWLWVGIALMSAVSPAPLHAEPSFTTTLPFYSGVDLNAGMSEYDRRVMIISFGEFAGIDSLMKPDDWTFDFSDAVDLHFEFDPGAEFPVTLCPGAFAAIAVLAETPFDSVDASLLGQLDLISGLSGISLGAGDTVVLLAADGTYFKLGEFVYDPDTWSLQFTCEALAFIPEPSSLMLVGVGLLLLTATLCP